MDLTYKAGTTKSFNKTQFQIEGGGLMQGVTKLITILFTFVTFRKNLAKLIDNKLSLFIIIRKCMVQQKKSNILKRVIFLIIFTKKI